MPTGADAFLKALDYSHAFRVPNTAQELQNLLNSFVFERENGRHMPETVV